MAVNPKFNALLEKIRDTHDRKNSNYARPEDPFFNFRGCEEIGIPAWKGVLVRMGDKWNRIQNLANGVPDRVGESILDTLEDLAVYALIDILLYKEELEKLEDKQAERCMPGPIEPVGYRQGIPI